MKTQIQLRPDRITYKIAITKETTSDYIGTTKEIVEKRHYTDAELNDRFEYIARETEKDKFLREIYGDVSVLKTTTERIEILTQTVTDLNLPQVIKAVNGL